MEMDPNLMRSTGVNLTQDEGPLVSLLDDLEPGVSWPATFDDRHFLTMNWMPTDWLHNFALQCPESPSAQREIDRAVPCPPTGRARPVASAMPKFLRLRCHV